VPDRSSTVLFERKYIVALTGKQIGWFYVVVALFAAVFVLVFAVPLTMENPPASLILWGMAGYFIFYSTVAFPRMEGRIRLTGSSIAFRVVPLIKFRRKEVRFSLESRLRIRYYLNMEKMRFRQKYREEYLLLNGLPGADLEEFIRLLRKLPAVKYSVGGRAE